MPRRIPHSGKINLDDYHIEAIENFTQSIEGVIKKAVTEVVAAAAEEELDAYFPCELEEVGEDGIGGPKPKDPLTIYVRLPLGDDNNPPHWAVSLRELIIQVIDSDVSFETQAKLRDGLRELADMLDRDIKVG